MSNYDKIKALAKMIRDQEKGSGTLAVSLMLKVATLEWETAIATGIMTEREYLACHLAYQKFSRLRAEAAIRQAFNQPTTN